jgi:tetratricopeptide (TPR) repeat protein
MEGRHAGALAIEHVESSSPPTFRLTRLEDRKSLPPAPIVSPYEFPVEGHPKSPLMRELRWYLEQFLDYPFHPETDHAEHVVDALRAWGTQAFNALFDRRDAGNWMTGSTILEVRADDPHILSWPWEALYDPQGAAFLAHRLRLERRLNTLPDPQPAADLPKECVNILLIVCRPYEHDVRYRSIARPLIELIQSKNLPVHVDILRPPTFDQLRERLREQPGYYHVLHFDGHGAYARSGYSSPHQFRARQGYLIFENEKCEPDPQSAVDIKALLRECPVPAVVLNACQSGTLDDQAENAFAAVATALLQSGMRSVVAMAYSLYVSGAQVFLPAFYGHLFESGSVAEGVRAGRQRMLADKNRVSARGSFPLEDWLLPVLYQQAPLNFDFAKEAKLETRESCLPQDVREHREACGFIGRDGPVLEMERALRRDAPCILVQGLGGVGKTTLARGFLRWLDDTGGLDKALWFDFRDIRTAEYVLNRTGEAFYGENFGAAPTKLDLLADALRRDRVLMVWDNFESAAENLTNQDRDALRRFLDVIRGTRGKVIMTSRSQEPWLGPALRFDLPLRGLEGQERWEYCEVILRELRLKVDRADPALNELMNQLAGHPLAMRVVLPKLEHMPAAQVSEALHSNLVDLELSELEEQGRLFATLRFVEQGLPEQLRPLVNLIAMHEGCLDAGYLEAMAKLVHRKWTRQRIDQLLTALGDAGLLRSDSRGIYEIHPLLTSYLHSSSTTPEVCQRAFVEVMGRVADELAPRTYHEQRGPFLLHGANFHVALRLAQRLNMDQYFGALIQSLAAYAQQSRNFVEAYRLFSERAQYCAAHADWKGEAGAYHHLGMIAQEQRDFATAREWYLKSLAIKEKEGNPAMTYLQLGTIALEEQDFATAREWYLKSVAISEKQGDLHGAALTYHQLGRQAELQRDFATALEWYLKSLAVNEKQGDLHGAALTYHQLGMIAFEQWDIATARKWYLKSLALSERHAMHVAASSYHQLGVIATDEQDFETARECYLKSLAIKEKHGDLHGAALTYHQLGMIAWQQEDFETAREWSLKSLDIKQKQGDLHGAANTYQQLGIIAQKQGAFATAHEWYLKSLDIKEKQGNLNGAASAYGQLGRLAAIQGKVEESGKWLARCISSFRETHDQHGAEQGVENFLFVYRQVSPEEQQRMEAIWFEARLGPFPA